MQYSHLAFVLLLLSSAACLRAEDSVDELVERSGVRGGLIVHVGCAGGERTVALGTRPSFIVHGLDTAQENVERARRLVRSRELYGKVSIDTFDGNRLPYVGNLANLIVADDLGDVPVAEVMRVLAPLGVAVIDGERLVKPWPDTIDEWTHFLHGADNNALADDTRVGPPRHMQWLAPPPWTRHHDTDKGTYPSVRAVVSSRGRLFYMLDETNSSDMRVASSWHLLARDGFSGVLLWRVPLGMSSFERRLEQVWRTLVADGEAVYAPYGPEQRLAALDAATGRVIRTYDRTDGYRELIKDGASLLIVTQAGGILALDKTGQAIWQWMPTDVGPIVPATLAAADGRVFVKTEEGICCLSAADGGQLWYRPLPASQKKVRLKYPHERLLVAGDVVLCSYGGTDPAVLNRDSPEYLGSHPRVRDYGGKLGAFATDDGHPLWEAPYMPGLESMPGEVYVCDGRVWLGPDFAQPRDLRTGKVLETRPVLDRLWTTGHHYRCYPGKATCNYILTAKRGIEMIDVAGEGHSRNNWVRGTCRVGVTPCNGLTYAPPHSCGCYMEAKLFGFWALSAGRDSEDGEHQTEVGAVRGLERFERGPAYGQVAKRPPEAKDPEAWPTYRGDAARSGSISTAVPASLRRRWKTRVGGRLSAVTVEEGRLFVAQVDAHTVHALDAVSGEPLWQFTAGGRVDGPPTLWGELALFGSRDGYVYCLRAADGELVWRYLAAPDRTRAVANDQVESLWPVHGSVLIHRGLAYVAAGRSSYLDGGIALLALDPLTGEVVCHRRLASEHAGASAPPPADQAAAMDVKIRQNWLDYKTFLAADRSDSFSMRGSLADVMTAEGGSIFMRQLRLGTRLELEDSPRPHLFSTSYLGDGSEHHRAYWVLGTGDFRRTPVAFPWILKSNIAAPYGLTMSFDEGTVWAVQRGGAGRKHDGSYRLVAIPRPDPDDPANTDPDFPKDPGRQRPRSKWSAALPMRPRATLRAGDAIYVAGSAADRQAVLHAYSAETGQQLGELPLDAPPVWDGMAAAAGRLYAALEDGSVVCLVAQR